MLSIEFCPSRHAAMQRSGNVAAVATFPYRGLALGPNFGKFAMELYNRLFRYRETPSLTPLENFLTESFADLFNRLPTSLRTEMLVWLLPEAYSLPLRRRCASAKKVEATTQVRIDAVGSVKRPDMIVDLDGQPLILFEVKVGAALQEHARNLTSAEQLEHVGTSEIVFQNQLKTYSDWIGIQSVGDWPGAVIFLTHERQPPDGFENDGHEGNSVIGVTRTWKDIGRWLAGNIELDRSELTHCALASDFYQFELLPVLKTPRIGVFMEPEVGHGKTNVYEGVQG